MMRTIAHNRSQPSDSSSAAATMSRRTPSRLWKTLFFPIGKEYHILDGLSTLNVRSVVFHVEHYPSSTTRVLSQGMMEQLTDPAFSMYK